MNARCLKLDEKRVMIAMPLEKKRKNLKYIRLMAIMEQTLNEL